MTSHQGWINGLHLTMPVLNICWKHYLQLTNRSYLVIQTRCYHRTIDMILRLHSVSVWSHGNGCMWYVHCAFWHCGIPWIIQRLLTNQITVLVLCFIIMYLSISWYPVDNFPLTWDGYSTILLVAHNSYLLKMSMIVDAHTLVTELLVKFVVAAHQYH